MATAKDRFNLFDVVTATDLSIQFAYANGLECPPTDELTVLGFHEEKVVLSDGSSEWHHSHFHKVRESFHMEDLQELLESVDDRSEKTPTTPFNEFTLLEELAEYIAGTYTEHYAKDGVQSFSLIAKRPLRGLHFTLANIIKYADRFGEKDGMNRKDLIKIAHYSILALFAFDQLKEKA
jgi:hypothetical protein